MADELIVIEKISAAAAYHDDTKIDELFLKVEKKAKELIEGADTKTKPGRDVIRSTAAKVSKTKTALDKIRSEETEEMRKQVAVIDERGKRIRDRFDALRDSTRKPLTDWENAEEARVEAIQKAINTARTLGQVAFGETSRQIQERIDQLPTNDLEFYQEFKDEAELVIETAYNNLTVAKTIAANAERDAAEREAERKELAEMRAAQVAREAEDARRQAGEEAARVAEERVRAEERNRIDEENRTKQVENDRRLAEAEAKALKAQEDADAATARARAAEEAAERAEQEARDKLAQEDANRKAAEQKSAEDAEIAAAAETKRLAEEALAKAEAAANRERLTNEIIADIQSDILPILNGLRVEFSSSDELAPSFDEIACAVAVAIVTGQISHVRAEI